MNLEEIYQNIDYRLNWIDFDALWSGFERLKFAIYTDNECFF